MKYKFYTTSEGAWGGMLEAISEAKKSVYLEMYIFADDTRGYDFFDTLKAKAKEGISVKVIIDTVGSIGLKSQAIADIRESGVELLFFSHWLSRTHKKILVVDEEIAFVGGVNIHNRSKKWNDLQIRLEGSIVKSILRSFARTYGMCGGKDRYVLGFKTSKDIFNKTKLWIFEHWHDSHKALIKKYYKGIIRRAENNITIMTPYFAPQRWFIGSLHQAVMKGVTVHVLLPEHTDYWIMDRVNYFYMYRLHKLGVVFYLCNKMNHAKAMLIDDKEGLVGSHNIDPFSFKYNIEAGIFFQEKDMVLELKDIIEQWKKDFYVFDPSNKKPKWFDYLISPLIRILRTIF